jgi:hypothetical protein
LETEIFLSENLSVSIFRPAIISLQKLSGLRLSREAAQKAQNQKTQLARMVTWMIWRRAAKYPASALSSDFQTDHFPGLAFHTHFKWAATNLAIRRETLDGDACIDRQFEHLPTKWALNGFGNFHDSFPDCSAGPSSQV